CASMPRSIKSAITAGMTTSITTSSTTKNGVSSASFLNSRTLFSNRLIIVCFLRRFALVIFQIDADHAAHAEPGGHVLLADALTHQLLRLAELLLDPRIERQRLVGQHQPLEPPVVRHRLAPQQPVLLHQLQNAGRRR